MPRAEDIAWKFVIRLGKKWLCPYCKNEYSGSVTRVRSHFLKQVKEGISSCTKVPAHIRMLMELLHNHQVRNKEDIAWELVNRLGDGKWRCHYCSEEFLGDLTGVKGHLLGVPNEGISICTQVPDHVRKLMQSLLDELGEEQSRDAHGQSSMEPPSCDMLTQAEVAEDDSREPHSQSSMEPQSCDILARPSPLQTPESLEYVRQLLPTPRGVTHMANFTQQGVIGLNYDQQSQAGHQFHQSSPMPFLVQISHVQPALVPPQHQSVLHQSINHETRDMPRNATMCLENLDINQQSDLHYHAAKNLVETLEAIVNTPVAIQMNVQHNPTVGSSLQNDLSLAVDSMNCLQDCGQPCVVEGVPGLRNTSPTNTVQHPDQLHTKRDREDGNDTRLFVLPTPMDINSSTASPHSSDSHNNLQVPDLATNTTGPSSSQNMNRGSPIMDVGSISANDEEMRNLKRKVEELDEKEAVIKEQIEIESAASSGRKKPKILVEEWLKETERARNNFQRIGQAHVETLSPKEQVKTLTRKVEELREKMLPQTLLIEERDAKGVKFLERKLTGEAIHRNIELIWDCLMKNHSCKLGIYGMGGVGKTTIMMHIHNRLLKDATFDGLAFITVSQHFNIYKLQSDIWQALKFGIMEDAHEKKRAAMLFEQLERKKYLLILDDVWEPVDLEEVGIPVGADGSKLVLTTRSLNVCCQMLCQEKIKIEPLSPREAKNLFLEEFGSKVPRNLEVRRIVKSIVKECAGLPLGLITMARSMRGVTDVFEWRDSLVKLKESSMGQTDMEKKVLMNLKFSFDRLGNRDVQKCFLSCALYPEDELIGKFKLIELFIDQGLICRLSTRKQQYDRGLAILNKLGNVGLLEDHGREMKMHNMIRDMALHIMGETSVVKAGKQLMRIPSEEYWTDALENVSLMKNNISGFPLSMSPNCSKLSTLLLDYGLSCDAVIPDTFFKKLCGLKVLNLSGYNMTELPNSISNLVNLRALSVRECRKLRRIPYLGKFTSLRKLDASGCEKLEELKGLKKLVSLRYLDLTETRIERLPKGTMDHLLNLQCLKVWAVNEEDITKLGALETFRCFLENVDDFNKCVRVIEQSSNPRYYNLNVRLEKSEFIVEVNDDARFGNERKVYIGEWGHAVVSVGGECTGDFILIPRDVQTMRMRNCDGTTNLSGIGRLKYLEKLKIRGLENLRVLCGGQDEEVIDIHDAPAPAPTPTPFLFPSLRNLKISACPKLKYLFGHGFISNLPCLRKIEIYGCKEMVVIIAAVTAAPPHQLPAFPSLKKIYVNCCDKMKRAVEYVWLPHFPNLRRITISNCENMEEIIEGPPPYLPVEEISLKYVTVSSCHRMRKLFSNELLLHLRNLESIEVDSCKGMVEMISGAGQSQEGSIMTFVNNPPSSFPPPISLPNLKRLYLRNLPQLESICGVPISCDSMEKLEVYKCPELKGIPLQLRLHDTKNLPHIWLEDEEKWKMLMWDHPDAQAILQPYLRKGEHAHVHEAERLRMCERLSSPNAIELYAKKGSPYPTTPLFKKALLLKHALLQT